MVPGRGQTPSQTAPAEADKHDSHGLPSAVCCGQGDLSHPRRETISSDTEDQVQKSKIKQGEKNSFSALLNQPQSNETDLCSFL